MKEYKIFTAGESNWEEGQNNIWRHEIENLITLRSNKKITFIHPHSFYMHDRSYKSWKTNQLKDSDVVIVNLNTIANSIVTHMELGIIDTINSTSNKFIYVIGIGEPNIDHTWISQSIFHREDTIQEAADFIIDYILL